MLRRLLLILVALVIVVAAGVYWLLSSDAVRRSLESQASAWLGEPVAIERASARFFPRVGIHLHNVRIGSPVHVTLALVDVSTDLRALLSRRIEQADISIADSRIALPLAFAVPTSGAGAGSGGVGGVTVGSIRTISLRNVLLVSRRRELTVSAESSLDGTHLNVQRFTARSGDTSVDASGKVELSPRIDATLEARASQLDLDDLLAVVDAFSPSAPVSSRRGAALPGRMTAKITASRSTAAGVELGNLAATVVAEGDRIMLSPIAFQLFDGRYDGTLDVDLGDTLAITLTGRVRDLDVARLAAFGGIEDVMTGRLAGSGRFNGRGRDMSAVLASSHGSGSAAITDGTIRGLDLVRTVVLFFGRPVDDAAGVPGDRFQRISAVFSVANQIVTSTSLTMNSPDLDVVAQGTLAVPTKALDARGDLVLSESLSKLAGTDLYRYAREGSRIVLPALVGGTLSEPRVRIDAAAAIRRGIRNEVEEQLKGLFDRLKLPFQP